MDMRTSHKLKEGALVRMSWDTPSPGSTAETQEGIVLGKKYVKERHSAVCLGGMKDERYDVYVHWFPTSCTTPGDFQSKYRRGLKTHQNWELMLISNGS